MVNKKVTIKTCVIFCIICIIFTATVYGSSTMKQIVAYLNYNLNVLVDGEVQEFYDAEGNRVYPISYSGTTYVPIRGVGEALGVEVKWNSASGNVEIATPSLEITTNDLLKGISKKTDLSYVIEDPTEKVIVIEDKTITFDTGISCKALRNQDFKVTDYIGVPLDKNIKSITFDVYSPVATSINIFNQQGKLLKTVYFQENKISENVMNVDSEVNKEIYFVPVMQNIDMQDFSVLVFNIKGVQ